MLTVKRELSVAQSQLEVWHFIREMSNWASQMPGYMLHEQLNEDDSVWTMQMNLGPFTRPIVMDVHVTQWHEPSVVKFTIKGKFDPFQGQGSFISRVDNKVTHITLDFDVEGTGSMAKVVTALAVPVLPAVADQFVCNLETALQQQIGQKQTARDEGDLGAIRTVWQRLLAWFRSKFQRGKKTA